MLHLKKIHLRTGAILLLSCTALLFSHLLHADSENFSPDTQKKEKPIRLKELYKITESVDYRKNDQGVKQIRLKTLKQAAFSWGVQEGLYWRYEEIVESLEQQSLELHTVFSFNKFIVDGKMLMPSVIEAERIFEQSTESTIRTVNISYTLDKPARMVPSPPTWRDYLLRHIDEPQQPHEVIFPRTKEEAKAWRESLDSGFEEGVRQANDIFEIDLRRLQKDIEGMYRFRKLLAMGIVTMPKISMSKYSVIELDNGKTLNINDVIYSITTQSDFNETDKWQPFFRQTGASQ
ncbi:type IV secretory system conjugative DNA transfer family protein [Microbulbifer epialgicus]|uniref:Type IV secretory system conjugative DNA transfer family protein n=1 Tax=Microbulbifer epialgicus TaxID=393907 RepID=A0ABV4NTQ2_9GAMM